LQQQEVTCPEQHPFFEKSFAELSETEQHDVVQRQLPSAALIPWNGIAINASQTTVRPIIIRPLHITTDLTTIKTKVDFLVHQVVSTDLIMFEHEKNTIPVVRSLA